MPDIVEAEKMLRDYVATQQRLCQELFERYPIDDVRFLTELPRHGSLSIGDGFWEFQLHGAGVCFTRMPEGEIVDAHVEPFAYPQGIDAWRILQYLESRSIVTLKHGTKEYDGTDEDALKDMLKQLCNEGRLSLVVRERRIYALPTAVS